MSTEDVGSEIHGPGRAYFDNVVTDNMLDALLELSAALWSVQDRQLVLEKVLASQGIDVSELIENHVPDETEINIRRVAREQLVQSIMRSFVRRPAFEPSMSPDAMPLRDIER